MGKGIELKKEVAAKKKKINKKLQRKK